MNERMNAVRKFHRQIEYSEYISCLHSTAGPHMIIIIIIMTHSECTDTT